MKGNCVKSTLWNNLFRVRFKSANMRFGKYRALIMVSFTKNPMHALVFHFRGPMWGNCVKTCPQPPTNLNFAVTPGELSLPLATRANDIARHAYTTSFKIAALLFWRALVFARVSIFFCWNWLVLPANTQVYPQWAACSVWTANPPPCLLQWHVKVRCGLWRLVGTTDEVT